MLFLFLLIRPQVKRQKDQQSFVDNLREGMEVVTSAGIVGKVTKIDGNIVRLLIDEKTYMRVLKQTVTGEYKV
ncbi:MAG: preprotein translocase subunit YajC [Lewinellaceae bacterium]|nr:preprotein translocase subunit YajC [Lewinellaceae bacterium]